VVAALAVTGVPDLVAARAKGAACAVAERGCADTKASSRESGASEKAANGSGRARGTVSGASTPAPSAGGAGPETPSSRPSPPPAETARNQLNDLTVEADREVPGYSRERFPHWSDQEGGCTTRDLVLKRDGEGVRTGSDCDITSGRWASPYDGRTWTRTGDVDIDHMVPLKEAWESGASEWSTDKREKFANDLRNPQLWSVTDNVNQEKSDQDPAEWQPPRKEVWCEYARAWIEVKSAWRLTVDQAEKKSLSSMLEQC
jgi:hypothetical protein